MSERLWSPSPRLILIAPRKVLRAGVLRVVSKLRVSSPAPVLRLTRLWKVLSSMSRVPLA